jgi:hypothetical protein
MNVLEISCETILISKQMDFFIFYYLNDIVGRSVGKSTSNIRLSMGKTSYAPSIGICWSVGISPRGDGRSIVISLVRWYNFYRRVLLRQQVSIGIKLYRWTIHCYSRL